MELGILDQTHPTYDCDRWVELEALSKGGDDFRALLSRFLPQNPVEPADVYMQRRAQAHYRSYVGSVINLYTAWLFAAAFSVKAYERDTETAIKNLSPFYGRFQENVGNETQFGSFIKERFRKALTVREAAWLVELPSNGGVDPESKADWEDRGLGNATLKAVDRHELLDWQEDETGALTWAIVHTCYETRESWNQARGGIVETWRVYDRSYVYTFQLRYEKGKRPTDPKIDVPMVGAPALHGFKRVPLVRFTLPAELCIGEAVFDTQLEHFRQDNALSWLIRRTCYAQPLFNLEDGDRPPTMGAGYAIVLGPNDKMGWTSPPVAPFDILQRNVDNKRDEIYRIVHQMAQGVDNNAETVGRSADSKEIDAAATRIMLNAYGELVSKPIEETYELISEARGETAYEWSIEGLAGYDTTTVSSLIGNSKEARELGIPSKSFHQELCTKVALAILPEADQRVKDKIREEIHSAEFEVKPLNTSKGEALEAKAELDRAKAKAEPIKAKAAAEKPTATPGTPPGGDGAGRPFERRQLPASKNVA